MRRGRSPISRQTARTSPDRSMSSSSRAKMRRSQSPIHRSASSKHGQLSYDKQRSPARTMDNRTGSRSNRSPIRAAVKPSRPSLSPRRHSIRSSLSPRRHSGGPTKRRSSVSPRRGGPGGGAPPVKKSTGPVTSSGRQQHHRSPPPSSSSSSHHAAAARRTAGGGARRSLTPPSYTHRRTESGAGHSSSTNVRSQVSGRGRGGILGNAPVRPLTGIMKKPHPSTHTSPPRWHPNTAEGRGKESLNNSSNMVFKENHAVDDRPHGRMNARVEKGEMMSNRGRPPGFGVQRNGGPEFGERQIEERVQRRSPSPFGRRERFLNEEGNYGGNNFSPQVKDAPRGGELPGRDGPPYGNRRHSQDDDFVPPPTRLVVPDSLDDLDPDEHSPGGILYTQDELKKITVDIFRNVPHDAQQSRRNFFNPEDVVVVRRPGEGITPIFDRDEIRHAAKTDALYMERRVVAIGSERHLSPQRSNQITEFTGGDDRENFRISTAPFNLAEHPLEKELVMGNQHHQSLTDRWQRSDMRNSVDCRNQNQFVRNTQHPHNMDGPGFGGPGDGHNSFPHDNQYMGGDGGGVKRTRSHSPESRQHLGNRFGGGAAMAEFPVGHRNEMFGGEVIAGQVQPGRLFPPDQRQRFDPPPVGMMGGPTQQDLQQQRRPMIDQHDLRHSLSKRRQSMDSRPQGRGDYGGGQASAREHDDRERDFHRDDKGGGRRSSRERGQPDRWAPDTTSDPRNRGGGGNWNQMQQPQDERGGGGQREIFNSGGGDGHLPNFSTRPDKYSYQEWRDKPDVVPKGSSYYEHDTRDDFQGRLFRGRGGFVPRGDRGGRGRPGGNFSGHRGGGGGGGGGGGSGQSSRGDGGSLIRSRGSSRGFGNNLAFNPRNKWSPSQWQHDKFETSPERKMNEC